MPTEFYGVGDAPVRTYPAAAITNRVLADYGGGSFLTRRYLANREN